MKKLTALLIMLLFVFTTACAAAEQGDASDASSEESVGENTSSVAEETSEVSDGSPIEESLPDESETVDENKGVYEVRVWIEYADDFDSTEYHEYSNGYVLCYRRCYDRDQPEKLSSMETTLKKGMKDVFYYSEHYDENGEVQTRRYRNYGDPNIGNLLASVSMDFEDGAIMRWSADGKGSSDYYVKDENTFAMYITHEDGSKVNTFYLDGQILYREKQYSVDGVGYIDRYEADMRLVSRDRTDWDYTENYLADGRVFRTSGEGGVSTLHTYTSDDPEVKYVATYAFDWSYTDLEIYSVGSDYTEEEAEELIRAMRAEYKRKKAIDDSWFNTFYGYEDDGSDEPCC